MKDVTNITDIQDLLNGLLKQEHPDTPNARVFALLFKDIIEYLEELKEYKLKTCPECKLEYHEWDCVVDGQQTGERYKVAVCKHCNYQRDIE